MDQCYKIIDWLYYNHKYIRDFIDSKTSLFDVWIKAYCQTESFVSKSDCGTSEEEYWVIAKGQFLRFLDRFDTKVIEEFKPMSYAVYFLKYQREDTDEEMWKDFNLAGGIFNDLSRREITRDNISQRVHRVREFGKRRLKDCFSGDEVSSFYETFREVPFREKEFPIEKLVRTTSQQRLKKVI
jgi:hypothetical protein